MKYILSLLTVLFCLVGSVAAQDVPAFFYPSNGAYVNVVGDSLIYYERTDGSDSIIVVFSQNGIYFRVHVADSALMTIRAVKLEIGDSLDEYSLTTAIAATYETITNVAKIGDDTATWKAVAAQAAADSGKWRIPEAAALTNLTTTAPLYKVSAGVVACSTATATLRGVAKFNTDNFGVASGDVTIKSGGVNSDEVLNNTLDTADMAHAPLGKFVRDSAASAIDDMATVLRTYSDTSQSTIKNDLFLYGDLSQVNHKVEFDLSNIWSQRPSPFFIDSIWWKAGDDYHWPVSSADSTNIRDTLDYIVFPTTFTSTVGLGDSLYLMDSGCVVHLSGQYIPQGWNGHKYWMTYAPLIGGTAVDENPHVAVSDDGMRFYEFISGNDTLHNPLWSHRWDGYFDGTPSGGNDTLAYCSDNNTLFDYDGDLWMIWRASYHGLGTEASSDQHDSTIVWGSYTSNGITWCNPVVLLSPGALGLTPSSTRFFSPTLVKDTSLGYWIFALELKMESGPPTWYRPYIIRYHVNDSINSTWSKIDTSYYPTNWADTSGPWHFDITEVGAEEWIMVSVNTSKGEAQVGNYIALAKSHDKGKTWDADTSHLLDASGISLAWDSATVYKPTCWPVDNGTETYLEVYLSGKGRRTNKWTSTRTRIDLIDSAQHIRPEYEWLPLTTVHAFDRPKTDSFYLSFPHCGTNGDTIFLFRDSAGNITPGDDDTATVSMMMPYAATMDSLEIMVQATAGASTGIIDVDFKGGSSGLGDSLLFTAGSDWLGTSWDTAGYAFSNDVSANAGEVYAAKIIMNFTADNNAVRVAWARIRVRR